MIPGRVAIGLAVSTLAAACSPESPSGARQDRAAPVDVAPVERGAISLVHDYVGSLEAPARFVVGPRIGGRVSRLAVDLGDVVRRGQVVAEIDDAELEQLAAQAVAEVAVAGASAKQARTELEAAARELQRVRTLRERGVASEAQLETAQATHQDREAAVDLAEAKVAKAKAARDAARIRLAYARVTADWTGGSDQLRVAERHASAGALVDPNASLFTLVQLTPLTAAIFVPESEYGGLTVGASASVRTDAYPGEVFPATVRRIAPVFEPGSRQARVELEVANAERRLKPGMFVRASIEVRTEAEATIVPFAAITRRSGESGVFVVDAKGTSVAWRPVELGIRDGERVEVVGGGVEGRVVVVGQQLIEDGAAIIIPNEADPSASAPEAAP